MFDLQAIQLEREVVGLDDSFVEDAIGYFVIHSRKGNLRAEHYTSDNMPTRVITCSQDVPLDKQAESLRKAILRLFPRIDASHYGYVCQELGKAQMAATEELEYIQD